MKGEKQSTYLSEVAGRTAVEDRDPFAEPRHEPSSCVRPMKTMTVLREYLGFWVLPYVSCA